MTREPRVEMLQVRVTPADKARLGAAAEALGMTVSDFIRFRTLPDRVARPRSQKGAEKPSEGAGVERAAAVRAEGVTVPPPAEFRCPQGSCEFVAGSGSARCPVHGRRVVAG